MPREGDPRVSLRLDPVEYDLLRAAAERSNVAVGALVRECVKRSATSVAADASAGRVTLRRRSASVPVPAPAASSSEVEKSEPPVLDAVSPSDGRGKITQPMVPAPEPSEAKRYVDGLKARYSVKTARDVALEKQKRLNEAKERA